MVFIQLLDDIATVIEEELLRGPIIDAIAQIRHGIIFIALSRFPRNVHLNEFVGAVVPIGRLYAFFILANNISGTVIAELRNDRAALPESLQPLSRELILIKSRARARDVFRSVPVMVVIESLARAIGILSRTEPVPSVKGKLRQTLVVLNLIGIANFVSLICLPWCKGESALREFSFMGIREKRSGEGC